MSTGENVAFHIQGATYPIELFNDAIVLRDRATSEARSNPSDGRAIPGPSQRAYSRATIFAAFNFLESLLVDLAQELANGAMRGTGPAQGVFQDIQARRSISETIYDWPLALVGVTLRGKHQFQHFTAIRQLRNQLIHPKLEPTDTNHLTQDQLLLSASAAKAAWVISQVALMAVKLYGAFNKPVPPEVSAAAGRVPRL